MSTSKWMLRSPKLSRPLPGPPGPDGRPETAQTNVYRVYRRSSCLYGVLFRLMQEKNALVAPVETVENRAEA